MPEIEIEDVSEEEVLALKDTLVRPFKKILKSCLFRVNIYHTPEYGYLFFDVHHMLMDGGSFGVFLQDITNAYFGRKLKKDHYFLLLDNAKRSRADGTYERDKEYFVNNYIKSKKEYKNILDPDHCSNDISPACRIKRFDFNNDQVRKAEKYWGVSFPVG